MEEDELRDLLEDLKTEAFEDESQNGAAQGTELGKRPRS